MILLPADFQTLHEMTNDLWFKNTPHFLIQWKALLKSRCMMFKNIEYLQTCCHRNATNELIHYTIKLENYKRINKTTMYLLYIAFHRIMAR